ncbi:MAG: glutamate--tRNA ligase [Clostridia bacterium]|nr:glutamate--tRNA ligase [Clostridia bacterium]
MDYEKLAELLFPNIDKTPEDYEAMYPARTGMPEGAITTRLAPSPTGFIHLGNLYGALADERLAHQSGGVCYLRVEDTDEKREVEGAIPVLLDTLSYFGINFDEGACHLGTEGSTPSASDPNAGERGAYGPYWQSARSLIYKACVKKLVKEGKAYPCFMTEEEIEELRKQQSAQNINPGVYGEYAKHRNLSMEEIQAHLDAGEKPVIRFKSNGDPSKYFTAKDAIRGEISMPENVQDVVILKKNDLPTYHFAHVVDDHLMHTGYVVRGEEWMASLPIHVQLFEAMGWEVPMYCHNTVLMKIDEATGQKRKLSKRKDPELGLSYYKELGYFPEAVREYLMTILNSDYEEWRIANPLTDYNEFNFSADKMSDSGTLFDLNKLNDVSKDVLAKKSAAEIYDFMLGWAKEYSPEKAALLEANKEMLLKVFDIDRGGEKPRKDLVFAQQIFEFVKYFFDDYFVYESEWPQEVSEEDRKEILQKYIESYDPADDNSAWFAKVKEITAALGYAEKPKDFKKNPDMYKGHVGHVSSVIRIAVTGRANTPDLWTIQQIMGKEMVERRVKKAQ